MDVDLDNLVNSLNSCANVSIAEFDSSVSYSRISEFKKRGSGPSNQEKRRQQLLDDQKKLRAKAQDAARFASEFSTQLEKDGEDDPTCARTSPSERQNRHPKVYADQLMCSEWLVDVPECLNTDWLMMLCPAGKRCTVAAEAKCVSKAFDKAGRFICSHKSRMPSATVLDCIYSNVDSTYYILDVLSWNGCPVTGCETDFRFQWLMSKVEEVELQLYDKKSNPYQFIPLPRCECDKVKMEELIKSEFPFKTELDGLLFYHRRTHYTAGTTPLVLWLKPFMLPEVLGVEIPSRLQNCHQSSAAFIAEYNCNSAEKKKKGRKLQLVEGQMDFDNNQVEVVDID